MNCRSIRRCASWRASASGRSTRGPRSTTERLVARRLGVVYSTAPPQPRPIRLEPSMARTPRPVRPLPFLLLLAAALPLFGDPPTPSAEDVRKLQSLFRTERTQAMDTGTVKLVP